MTFFDRWIWPAGGSGGIPGDVVATLVWVILAGVVTVLLWPPLRERVKRWFTDKDAELHRKLDHIIRHHPNIPTLPAKDAMLPLTQLQQYSASPFPNGWPADHLTFSSPTDATANAVGSVVGSASTSLVVAMYSFTHPMLISLTAAAIGRNVPTLIVLDSSEYANAEEQRELASIMALRSRPNLRLSVGTAENGSDIMHRKVAVIDGQIVVTGSFNWTTSATREDNQCTIGLWPDDGARLTASIEATYAWQMAHCPQPAIT